MKRYNPHRPLISIHVPKCGGSSFRHVLETWFDHRLRFHYIDEVKNVLPPRYRLKRRKLFWLYYPRLCIHGHFNADRGFGVADYYPEVDQFITVLRDPFEVAVSLYFYAKKLGDKWHAGEVRRVTETHGTLNAFLRDNLDRPVFVNYMPQTVTADNYVAMFENRFVHVGIMEDLQTSIDAMAAKLGLPTVHIPHKNVSRRDEPVDPGLRREFEARHALEYAMYEWACANYRHAG